MAQLTGLKVITVEALEEELGVLRLPRFVQACEQDFLDRVAAVADTIASRYEIDAVFISGPTSSGKTTFSARLTGHLAERGRIAHVISLDDYYRIDAIRYDPCGRPDFESIDTLETDLLAENLQSLLSGEATLIPIFDFKSRRRILDPQRMLKLSGDDILLVEGLHGLSGQIIGQLPPERVYGVYLMPWCSLLDGRQLLGSRALRMMRRISRDVLHRGSTALSTIDYWPMLDRTEEVFFPPYLARADVYINTCLPYEFCVIPPLASKQIELSLEQYANGSLPGSIYLAERAGYADLETALAEARSLVAASARIPSAGVGIVPEQSILREFIA